MRPWEEVIPKEDRAIYQKAGFGRPQAYGVWPGVLIVDVVRAFVGSRPMPVLEAVEEYWTSCGMFAWEALPHISRLLAAARRRGLPVVYTMGMEGVGAPVTTKRQAQQSSQERVSLAHAMQEIPPELSPEEGERVLAKPHASAFFQTGLAEYLCSRRVDCLLVCGTATSGCVRASVVDAYSHGFRTFVVEECTFDRSMFSHLVSLFELNAKYASVITIEQTVRHLESLGAHASVAGG
ncbi:MAG: isochorismatase family protein [Chloroflexi bacterium]|nr:isochorismatase family protein [Chloroflexota bacterium]